MPPYRHVYYGLTHQLAFGPRLLDRTGKTLPSPDPLLRGRFGSGILCLNPFSLSSQPIKNVEESPRAKELEFFDRAYPLKI